MKAALAPAPAPSSRDAVLYLGMALLGTLWGLGFSMMKLAAVHGIPAMAFAFWQTLLAGLLVLGLAAWRGRMPSLRPDYLRYALMAGGIGIALPSVVAQTALGALPAGVFAVMIQTVPMMTYGMSLAVGLEHFVAIRFAGIALGFVGALALVVPEGALPAAGLAGWVLFGFITPTCYAFNNVALSRLRPSGADSIALAAAKMLAAAAILGPLMLVFDQLYLPLPVRHAGDVALMAQVGISTIAFALFFELQRQRGPVFTSQVGYVVTATGLFWGWLLFNERHSVWIWLAVASIVAGMVLVSRRPDAARRRANV
ncbi:MAG: DMT family transporter [Geminicoccaceae bacterium]